MKKVFVISLIVLGLSKIGICQDPLNSVYTVPSEEKMYKNTIWREMNLKEKINTPFFSKDRQISGILVEAMKSGLLQGYKPDITLPATKHEEDGILSGLERMSKDEFLEAISLKQEESGGEDWGGGAAEGGAGGGWDAAPAADDPFAPTEIQVFDMTNILLEEDIFFDKVRSRMYNEIKTLTIRYMDATGVYKPIVTLDYREVETFFRENPEKAIWYNLQNSGQHRNMADAFLLKLYHAKIVKMTRNNPEGNQLIAMYGGDPELVLYKSQELEFKLAEYESDLWEY